MNEIPKLRRIADGSLQCRGCKRFFDAGLDLFEADDCPTCTEAAREHEDYVGRWNDGGFMDNF